MLLLLYVSGLPMTVASADTGGLLLLPTSLLLVAMLLTLLPTSLLLVAMLLTPFVLLSLPVPMS